MGKRLIRKYDSDGNLISMECSKCHEIKEVSEFFKHKNKKFLKKLISTSP